MKPDKATAVVSLRLVLAKAAPNASEADLSRFSESIVVYAFMSLLEAQTRKRGTKPALKSLAAVNKKIVPLARAIGALGKDELSAMKTSQAA